LARYCGGGGEGWEGGGLQVALATVMLCTGNTRTHPEWSSLLPRSMSTSTTSLPCASS
jgi:hypothetical protein